MMADVNWGTMRCYPDDHDADYITSVHTGYAGADSSFPWLGSRASRRPADPGVLFSTGMSSRSKGWVHYCLSLVPASISLAGGPLGRKSSLVFFLSFLERLVFVPQAVAKLQQARTACGTLQAPPAYTCNWGLFSYTN
jgi:hypothetical protein